MSQQAEEERELSRYEAVLLDPRLLLADGEIAYDGWEHQIANELAFHVRGFTWFRDKVLANFRNITDLKSYIPQMKTLVAERSMWLALPFEWSGPFSDRQLVDAASLKSEKRTPKFQKALEILALCEAVAAARTEAIPGSPEPEDVYTFMRIEPAVSYVHGLDRGVVNELTAEQFRVLRAWTGQRSNDVFYDMADGKTVTHKLALRTLNYFSKNVKDSRIGDVDFLFSRKRIYRPSLDEIVDVKTWDLPEETGLEGAGQPPPP